MDVLRNERRVEVEAARIIERCWCCYRDRQIFKLLKYAICAAEHSLSKEIMRKISPNEAELLDDPTCQPKIRFRFGGSEYPPVILFKVFIKCGEGGLNYYSGKRMIQPASKAAEDSCKLMGNRKFYDQMIIDACQTHQDKITNELDINTMKDFMQYLSYLDECPPENGGKSNLWRKLTLDVIPRHNIVHDVVTYLNSGNISERLALETPFLISAKPVTQKKQLNVFLGITNLSVSSRKHDRALPTAVNKSTVRRSQQARKRVSKMKKFYGFGTVQSQEDTPDNSHSQMFVLAEDNIDLENPYWEDEADKLYEWSQDLTLEDLGVTTPVF